MNKTTLTNAISLKYDATRFALAGIVNTLLTLAIYQLSLLALPHLSAYAISWLVGIAFLVIVYPSRVFPGANQSIKSKALIVLIYLTTFSISALVLDWLVDNYLAANIAIFAVLIFSTCMNFILMRLALRK